MLRSFGLLVVIIFFSCNGTKQDDPCTAFFEPYPDHITGRTRTNANGAYLDAMVHYGNGDLSAAKDGLKQFLEVKGADKSAYMYLACCHLALGEPFEAELQLDHLERSNTLQFKDQTEWYTVLCWLCSDQTARAKDGAAAIASAKAHTYSKQASTLLKVLERQTDR